MATSTKSSTAFNFLLIIVASMLTSCSILKENSDQHLFQKRKYNKGYFINARLSRMKSRVIKRIEKSKPDESINASKVETTNRMPSLASDFVKRNVQDYPMLVCSKDVEFMGDEVLLSALISNKLSALNNIQGRTLINQPDEAVYSVEGYFAETSMVLTLTLMFVTILNPGIGIILFFSSLITAFLGMATYIKAKRNSKYKGKTFGIVCLILGIVGALAGVFAMIPSVLFSGGLAIPLS